MKTSEVLDRAADLIENGEWGKGPNSIMGEGGLCIMGAVYAIHHGGLATSEGGGIAGFALCPAGSALYEHLRDRDDYITTAHMVWHFNDDPKRTKGEVIEVLRACAVIEASRERETAEVSA